MVLNADVLTLYLVSAYGRMKVEGYKVSGNIIEWVFRGKDQKAVGDYTLELVSREGEIGMLTTDRVNAFTLVSHTYQESLNPTEAVEVQTVEISSEVVLSPVIDLSGYLLIEDVATINGQPLTNGGNIEINEYDDAELREAIEEQGGQLTKLSERIEENEVLIEDLQNTKIDREADDYYPKLAVGLADNLAGVDVVDSEINFRRSGGGAISDGVARIDAIKGNSVVWNQIVDKSRLRSKTSNNVTFTNNGDGTVSVSTTEDGATADVTDYIIFEGYKGKTILLLGCPSGGNINTYCLMDGSEGIVDSGNGAIKSKTSPNISLTIRVKQGTVITTPIVFRPRIYDLTQMFVAGNEPTTIEEFYARIPMGVDLNAYNEGEVIHMDVQSIESQGVNAWDEEWEVGALTSSSGGNSTNTTAIRSKNYIAVIPSKYYVKSPSISTYIFAYDKNQQFISLIKTSAGSSNVGNTEISIGNDVAYIRFYVSNYGTTYNHDICINLSDTSINGKYFPYIKRVEDLSIIRKYFPQGMKSAGTAHDEIRYNKATQKWEKVVRIGEVDLGSLKWSYATATGIFYASASYFFENQSLLSAKYANNKGYNEDKNSYAVGGSVRILDSAYTDVASFKAAMNGVILYYELAEPIVTELDAEDQFKDLDYQVWNCGTEKAIAEGKSAPLAADITYGFNAIGKIKELESLVAALRAKVGI